MRMAQVTSGNSASVRSIVLRVGFFWGGYLAILYSVALIKSRVPAQWGGLVWGGASSLLIVGMTWLFLGCDRRRFGGVGLNLTRGSAARLVLGAVAAVAIYALIVVLVATLLGPLQFARATGQPVSGIVLTVITTLVLATMEELGFRGYPLRTLVPVVGHWPAQLIVAVAFGACHVLFGYSWQSILVGVIPCGLLFGVAATASRGLAMPIGLHTGLNLAQWAMGEKGGRGIWTIIADDQTRVRIASFSPVVVVAVTLAGALTFWIWGRSRKIV